MSKSDSYPFDVQLTRQLRLSYQHRHTQQQLRDATQPGQQLRIVAERAEDDFYDMGIAAIVLLAAYSERRAAGALTLSGERLGSFVDKEAPPK